MENVNSINNLLQQVSIIHKKYDDIAELTGEKFNVFQLLNVNHYENTHSSILSYFLNSKENHGQKDLFLKLFFEVLDDKFSRLNDEKHETILPQDSNFGVLDKFQTLDSESLTEHIAGKIDEDYLNGGRIDILLRDKFKQQIIIENKIYAVDQENQLVRYNNFDKKAPIFYLNLFNDNPSDNSKGGLTEHYEFFIISYEIDIVHWLEKCIKECVNKPFIRETLNQYLNLIKELTNQSTNKIMEKEIIELLKNNFESYMKIAEIEGKLLPSIINDLKINLTSHFKTRFDLDLGNFNLSTDRLSGFDFTNEELASKNLKIKFSFFYNNYSTMSYGIEFAVGKCNEEKNIEQVIKIKEGFNKIFFPQKSEENDETFPVWLPFYEYANWNDNNCKAFSDILNGEFIRVVEEKVMKMLKVVKEL